MGRVPPLGRNQKGARLFCRCGPNRFPDHPLCASYVSPPDKDSVQRPGNSRLQWQLLVLRNLVIGNFRVAQSGQHGAESYRIIAAPGQRRTIERRRRRMRRSLELVHKGRIAV